MTKLKLKEKNSAKASRREEIPQVEQVSEYVSQIRDSWREEILQLQSRQFYSLEELVEHFVVTVAAKMGKVPDLEARKDYLRDFFLQDEMLCRELANLFSISRKSDK